MQVMLRMKKEWLGGLEGTIFDRLGPTLKRAYDSHPAGYIETGNKFKTIEHHSFEKKKIFYSNWF